MGWYPFYCSNPKVLVELGEYQNCWSPVALSRQVISIHGSDYIDGPFQNKEMVVYFQFTLFSVHRVDNEGHGRSAAGQPCLLIDLHPPLLCPIAVEMAILRKLCDASRADSI